MKKETIMGIVLLLLFSIVIVIADIIIEDDFDNPLIENITHGIEGDEITAPVICQDKIDKIDFLNRDLTYNTSKMRHKYEGHKYTVFFELYYRELSPYNDTCYNIDNKTDVIEYDGPDYTKCMRLKLGTKSECFYLSNAPQYFDDEIANFEWSFKYHLNEYKTNISYQLPYNVWNYTDKYNRQEE